MFSGSLNRRFCSDLNPVKFLTNIRKNNGRKCQVRDIDFWLMQVQAPLKLLINMLTKIIIYIIHLLIVIYINLG